MNDCEIAVVGGGPAGAALAMQLARAGHETVLFERLRRPRWRACGVYTSPLTRQRLSRLGLDGKRLDTLIRPISAMVVRPLGAAAEARLEYPAPHHACGMDRVRLEEVLLELALRSGAQVHEATPVTALELGGDRPQLIAAHPDQAQRWRARLIVGADGPISIVARSAGVALATRRFRRAALTVHRHDPFAAPPGEPMDAEMLVGAGWYCGVAPVPGARVNLGLVLGEAQLRRQLAVAGGPRQLIGQLLEAVSAEPRSVERAWLGQPETDELRVALPLVHRVRRAAGEGFLLIGDAAGFVDPLSGEGLQRALASAELAAAAIGRWSRGDTSALAAYDQQLRARFRGKDMLSWLLQLFLFNSALTTNAVRNLERRAELRRRLGFALADLRPASDVLNPAYLARLFAPWG